MTLRVVTPNIGSSGKPLRTPPGSCALSLAGELTWRSDGDHPLFDAADTGTAAGTPFQQLWHGDDQANILRCLAAARQRGQSRFSARAAHNLAWVEASIQLRRDGERKPCEFLVSVTLATEEETVVDDYMTLFNAAPVAMWTAHDPDAAFILGNPASEKRYQYPPGKNQSLSPSPGEELPQNYRLYRDGREVPANELPMQRAVRGEHVLDEDYEMRLENGRSSHVILNASPMRDARGKIVGAVCVDIDITERKRFEAAQTSLLNCSRSTGPAFFAALVKAISETLGARQVYVAEISQDDERCLRTIAAHIDGKPGTYGDFIPDNSPCAEVAKGTMRFIPTGVLGLYPNSPALRHNRVDSYIGTPLRSADGKVIGIIGVLHDTPLDDSPRTVEIVEIFASRAAVEIQRLRTEESLRLSEKENRIIADAVPAMIAYLDADLRYRFANAAMKTWFDMDPSDARGKHLSEIIGVPAFKTVEAKLALALAGEHQLFEALVPFAHGGARHVRSEYVPYVDDGQVRGLFAFINDISDNKASAEALSKSEQQFRTLFEHLPLGAALVDRNGLVLLENDVFSKILPEPSQGASQVASQVASQRGSDVFMRGGTLHVHETLALDRHFHPVRLALQGQVARDVEFLCRHETGAQVWVRMSGIPIRDGDDGEVTGALVVAADIQGEKRDETRRTLLINELNHRVKNTLAGVQSIASQTFRASTISQDSLNAFEERLLALSNVHNLLTQEHWEGADLSGIVRLVLEPHDPGGNRLSTSGPSLRLKPPAALAFSMALHELATNAVKYGAFSTSHGKVDLRWQVATEAEGRRLRVAWTERGGPPVVEPTRKGFGTRLIERSLAFELASATRIRYQPEGVVCEIDADLSEISN